MTREEAAKMIKDDMRLHHDYLSGEYRKALKIAIKALEQPERKKGKWIRDAVWFTRYYCSQCGEKTEDTIMGEPRYKWCPMCGADMRTSEDK